MQAEVLLSFEGTGIMKIKTHYNVVERQPSMTPGGLLNILPGKPLYVYMTNLAARPINLPKFKIVTFMSNGPTCNVPTRDNEPHMLKYKTQIPTQCDKMKADPTVNAICYKPFAHYDRQVGRHNAVKVSNKI